MLVLEVSDSSTSLAGTAGVYRRHWLTAADETSQMRLTAPVPPIWSIYRHDCSGEALLISLKVFMLKNGNFAKSF